MSSREHADAERKGSVPPAGKATRSSRMNTVDPDVTAAAGRNPATRLGAGALVFAVASIGLTVLLSAVPWSPADAGRALVRLSWRATGVLIQECRSPTEEENARLPAHMRQAQICEGRALPFVLEVAIDGRRVVHDTVEATGARGDRPVYILRDIEVEPGAHDVLVTFQARRSEPVGDADAGPNGFPRSLRLESRVTVEAGEVALITYDTERRRLVTRP